MAGFAEQAIRVRKAQTPKFSFLFGGTLDEILPDKTVADRFLASFNAAIVPMSWSQLESEEGKRKWELTDRQLAWSQANELRILGGPLLELDHRNLPDWLSLWEGDFDNILSMMTDHIRAVATRYQNRVHLWHCVARANTAQTLSLTEEQALRLTVRAIETVRNVDPRTPVMVSFDQPWGEYLGQLERDLSPLNFADALVRSDLGVSGIGLEINLGTGPRATLPRDALELSRQLDRWTTLGLPLVILLTVPNQSAGFAGKTQLEWLDRTLQLLYAKAAVHAVFWNQLPHESTGEMAHRGLLDAQGQPNAVFAALAEFRRRQGI